MSVNRSILLLSIIFIIGFGTQESFATNPEFVTILPEINASLQAANTGFDVIQVSINTDVLTAEKINLSVFGETIEITHDQTIFRNSTDYTFVGSTPGLDKNVFITVFGDKARLEMSISGENYVLMPNGNAHQISNFANIASTIGDNPAEGQSNPDWPNIIASLPTIPPNSNTHGNVEIDVIFLYTQAAIDNQGSTNIRLMANQGIDKANIAFETSDIPIELVNVEIDGVGTNHPNQGGGDYIEGDISEDLERLTVTSDGYMERGNAVRDNEDADIGVLFLDIPSGPFCGWAPYILGDEEHAFVAVNVDCAGEFIGHIIAHEIGHVMGARHQFSSDSTTIPFEFGHAFQDIPAEQQTLMVSSFFSCADCTNYVMWSDPNETIFGTTDPAGDELHTNNAKVIALTGAYVASFRGGTETNVLIDNEKPIITLNGITPPLEVGVDTYTELGATVSDNDPAYSGTVTVGGDTVNTNIVGSYTVTYTAPADASGNIPIAVNRIVIVQDTISPVITLTGAIPQIIELGDGYTELGATTDDGSEVIIDATEFTDAIGSYSIYYDATDASGNVAIQVTRTVDVVDTIPPIITLTGANPQTIELGDGYTELGATTDDGSLVTIDDSAFVDAIGSYSILYDSVDIAGNNATQVTRTVDVVDTIPPIITLTGANPQTIELGDGYTELGATTDDGSLVTIDDSAFVDAIGSYSIYYDATDTAGNNATQEIRTVVVFAPHVEVIFMTSFDGSDGGGTKFDAPVRVAVDNDNRIIVGDLTLDIIQIYDSNGLFITSFDGSGGTEFINLYAIAVDNNNRIIVSDLITDIVQIFESDGTFVKSFNGTDGGGTAFSSPAGVAVDNDNRIIVTDASEDIVQIYDSNGNFLSSFDGNNGGTKFINPIGVAVDSNNRIIVSDYRLDTVQIFDSNGKFIISFDGSDGGTKFENPIGIAVDDSYTNGKIIVGDNTLGIVQIFELDTLIFTTQPYLNDLK